MKARAFTCSQRKVMEEVIQHEVQKQAADVANRAQALWMAAMLNADLSVRTVNRVLGELQFVVNQYGAGAKDGVSDYALFAELIEKGVKILMPEGVVKDG